MAVPVIGSEDIARLLPMEAAIDALEIAFAGALPDAPLRSHLDTPSGSLLLMPSIGSQGVGVKLVTLTRGNPGRGLPFIHAMYVLFGADSQAPQAVLDGASLTALRTAAVSGLATRWLAREDARKLVVFGAGVQARSHVEAMLAVRPVEEIVVVSRTSERAEALAAQGRARGLAAWVGDSDAVPGADLICTCTSSERPVLRGELIAPGTHVNAVGAYTPKMREIDTEGVRRARVVVETRAAALAEAGDLLIPLGEGAIGSDHIVADLAEVVGGTQVRRSPEDITLFKSVGVASEDLVIARAAVDRLGL